MNAGTYVLDTDGAEERSARRTSSGAGGMCSAPFTGGVRLLTLYACGSRGQGSLDDLRRADAMFTWHPAPWCQEIF